MSDIWSPTLELRWQEVKSLRNDSPIITDNYTIHNKSYVLQQKWVDLGGKIDWRDVPISKL